MNDFSIELAMDLYKSQDLFPVDFDDAWVWIGYTQKKTAQQELENNFEEGMHYVIPDENDKNIASANGEAKKGGQNRIVIKLTIDCFKSLAIMAGTPKGKKVRRYFLECVRRCFLEREKIAKQKAHQIPNLTPRHY